MKKVLVFCLSMVMVVAMSVSAFAAPGKFVASPSGVSAPELIDYSNESDDCTAELVITPYSERHTLSDDARAKLEKAYSDIVNATDVTDLNADLAKLASEKKIDTSKLAVSDLFDISYINCEEHDDHGAFLITLKPEALKNFVGLLHLNGDNWELVKDAKVVANGAQLTFTAGDLSPFAIVVNTDARAPQTGDYSNIGIYIALMAVSVVALVVIGVKLKKRAN